MRTQPFAIRPAGRPSLVLLVITVVVLAACGQTTDEEPDPTSPPSDETSDPGEPDDGTDDGDTDDDGTDDADPEDADPDDGTTGGDDGEPSGVDALAFTDCEAAQYTVGYPQEWSTNDDDGLLGPCAVFHPGEIDEPEQPRDRDLGHAVSIYVDEVDYDRLDPGENRDELLEDRETTVDGRTARVVEYRSSGRGLVPEDELSYSWIVDLDGEILVATTSSVGDTDYARDKQVITRMVAEELRIHAREPQGATPVAGPSTVERSTQDPEGRQLTVTDIRVGSHGSFDRVTFEVVGDGDAGWSIEYVEAPNSQGSGQPVDVDGGAVLRVAVRGIALPADAPAEPYDGPGRIEPERTEIIVEVVQDVLFEGVQDFFIGLEAMTPYRVERLSDPQRIVIDIEHG